MTKNEKNTVLMALVSNIRYIYNENEKLKIYSIDNNHVKELKALYIKLNNQYNKNNLKLKNGYINYLQEILQEILTDIETHTKEVQK